ncbi:dihydroorotase, multifunctional complex type [Candidatus Methanoperedens nitroreducens]|uniref:Dihydroorotase n=1 Tax=Candidatus Methanoperedens nitratireducens TaxID=1392998 RepID=A0A062V6Y4_9EURY|nr:dihydroorotase [Candidatus Methanoperedens nitroreducens]KCZ72338.1 dihydroorotase, multifunctional complex type [Candidatus Methanoperedens nitroreducens]MDJ1423728.1 dihydroorotase [Candidatus Methanoperedens sp.]
MPDLVIKNARLLIDDTIQPAEIAVDDGRISKIGKIISTEEVNQVIDAKGALVLPGAIDLHVHFRDPGMTKKEDWYTGSCAAAAGGVTTVIDHPNTNPPTIDIESFKKKQKEAKKSIIDYSINAGVTSNLQYLRKLWELGAMAFGEIFMAESTGSLNVNDLILKRSLEITGDLGAVACIHAEDEEIMKRFVHILKGKHEPESYSKSRPELSEKTAVEKAIRFAGDTATRLHLCHISAHESLEVIRRAKAESKNITCEVTPHHLFLSTKDWKRLGTLGKMNPPLRDFYSQQSLWVGLTNGIIDVVASDHAPHLEHEKMTDIWSAPAGVPGVETMLPLMLMSVKRNLLTLKRLIEVTSLNPARIFGLNKGVLAPGYDADMIITGEVMEIRREKLHSKAGWTPYNGMYGMFPRITISRGDIVFEDGDIIAKRGRGRFIPGQGLIYSKQ